MDKKIKAMLVLFEEDSMPLDQRVEPYSNWRLNLLMMVEEFNRAYHSWTGKYEQLRVELGAAADSGSSSSPILISQNSIKSFKSGLHSLQSEALHSNPESVVEDPDLEYCDPLLDLESLTNLSKQAMSNESWDFKSTPKVKIGYKEISMDTTKTLTNSDIPECMNCYKQGEKAIGDFQDDMQKQGNSWSELSCQVKELIEESLQHQAELVRRNDKKREVIKDLSIKLDRLRDENKALRNCLGQAKVAVKKEQSKISNKAEHDLMVQGKDERLGSSESFRMEKKARRASAESPLRASSAMMEFQEKTSVRSTYLLKRDVRFGLVEQCLEKSLVHKTEMRVGLTVETFIRGF
ncbi:Protein Networked (NET), actin-binding (NAB) domain [Dillenia turbinata]|uniref:Protein Networked (NET), actin-binding (NAB) domain n=1 Tax=Dillenia turbinata TaxID=194707 RepID=A0AAN8UJH5_9MAGN